MNIYFHYKSKYERWYYNIIKNAKCQIRFKGDGYYYERHHIIPKAFNGPNTNENLVLLTYREHLLCHWLLTKMYEGANKAKMIHAFWALCSYKNDVRNCRKTPFRILEAAKISRRKILSEEKSGEGNPMFGKRGGFRGKSHSAKHRKNISGEGNPMYGKTHSKEARQKMSEEARKRKGKPKSKTMASKLSKTVTGRKRKYLEDGSWTWEYPT